MTDLFQPSGATVSYLDFGDLVGWAEDDHAAALLVFLESCSAVKDPVWRRLEYKARGSRSARAFFENNFRPTQIEDGRDGLFTGYFEPDIAGARARSEVFPIAIYRAPPELPDGGPWLSRSEIEDQRVLEGRGLEIAWIGDPVDRYFLQVQGSGRIVLNNGEMIRVGFSATNGQPYRSVGQELIRRRVFDASQISADAIKTWARKYPVAASELFRLNPSYVFFREIGGLPVEKGPLGAMNRSVTQMRSLAVDPAFTPLGAPVWIETAGKNPLRRLMVAQDTGAAIKGAQRADIFFGSGDVAGRVAGAINDAGRMIVLLPNPLANSRRVTHQP